MKDETEQKFYSGKGSQQRCFDENKDKSFFLMHQMELENGNHTNTYSGFLSINAYLKYVKKNNERMSCDYELIKEGQECIEYYDIDARTDIQGVFKDKTEEEIMEDFIEARLEYHTEMLGEYNIPLRRKDFYITATPGLNKVSLHIYIRNGYKFKNNHIHLKKFVNGFREYCKIEGKPVDIDMSVYSRNRCFRLINNHKFGQPERICSAITNTNTNIKNFYARYIENNDKYYFEEQVLEETQQQKERVNEIYDESTANDKLLYLLKLIEETVADGTSPLCDEEFGNKVCYHDYIKISFAFLNVCEETNKPIFFSRTFNLYRRAYDVDYAEEYKKIKSYNYEDIGIRSIHYWAKVHPEYKEKFAKEIAEYKTFNLYKIFDWKFSLARKKQNNKIITYGRQLRDLTCITKKSPPLKTALEYTIKNLIKYVYQEGKENFYIDNEYYDMKEGKRIESYEYESRGNFLSKVGKGKIQIYYLMIDFKKKYTGWLEDEPRKGTKAYDKWAFSEPKMYVLTYLELIIESMICRNELTKYTNLTFEPYLVKDKNHEGKDNLNLFKGYTYDLDCGGDKDKYKKSLFRNNIRHYLCNGEIAFADWFEYWIAHAIQKPMEKCTTMTIFIGEQGTGKDIMFGALRKIIGKRYTTELGGMSPLFDKFNKSLDEKLFIRINEIKSRGEQFANADKLKDIIDREWITIEPKGKEKYESKQCARFLGFGNEEDLVKVENRDRRFSIQSTNNAMAQNSKYFKSIVKEMNEDFYKSMFMYYATLDISEFNPCRPCETSFKTNQKEFSEPKPILMLRDWYYEEKRDKFAINEITLTALFGNHFADYSAKNNYTLKMGHITFNRHIKKLLKPEKVKGGGKKLGVVFNYKILQEAFRKYYNDDNFRLLN